MMSCNQLIEKFKLTGGKLECRYDTQKCKLLPLEYECNLNSEKPTEQSKIDEFLFELSAGGNEYIKFFPKKTQELTWKLHRYQNIHDIGFDVEFYKDRLGDWKYPDVGVIFKNANYYHLNMTSDYWKYSDVDMILKNANYHNLNMISDK